MKTDVHYDELKSFIQTKPKADPVSDKKLLYFFISTLQQAYWRCQTQLKTTSLIFAPMCAEIIRSVFQLVWKETQNLKLVLFLCERATLLFIEYHNLSGPYKSEQANLLTMRQFILHKTIGPLHFKSEGYVSMEKIDSLMLLWERFFQHMGSFPDVELLVNASYRLAIEYEQEDIVIEGLTDLLSHRQLERTKTVWELLLFGFEEKIAIQDDWDQVEPIPIQKGSPFRSHPKWMSLVKKYYA